MLTLQDYNSLSPYLILLVGSLIILLIESFNSTFAKKSAFAISILTLIATGFAVYLSTPSINPLLTSWVKFDLFTKKFFYLFILITIATVLLMPAFIKKFKTTAGEFYFLLLSALFGLMLIAAANDFLTLFLGIETLSIPLYILVGYKKEWNNASEASLKYFLMGALSSAFLIYGIALIYGAIGTTSFDKLATSYKAISNEANKTLFLAGISFITLSLCFKVAAFPFHLWAPDVYDGAPTPITAFMAVGTKAGAIAAFARVFLEGLLNFDILWNEVMALIAIITLLYANFVALRQTQLRRFFAYSSISQAGFLLIPLVASMPESLASLYFYLSIYALATFGCFAALTQLDKDSDGPLLTDLQGLFYKSPWLTGVMTLCLLTLAGMPPTAGFFAKFYVFKLAYEAHYYVLLFIAIAATILSTYYYLRLISVMFASHHSTIETDISYSYRAKLLGTICSALLILFSITPMILLHVFS